MFIIQTWLFEMKHIVVMTFPANKWDVYGYCMKGFLENWPKEVDGYAIVEQPELIPIQTQSNLKILDFEETVGERVKNFEKRNKDRNIFDMGTTGNIAKQAAKFARKAFAQLHILENIESDVIWYIDADLYTHKKVSLKLLDKLSNGTHYLGCTPRWWMKQGFTETGLMMWNKRYIDQHTKWCSLYSECYDKDKIFEFAAWHDCIAFDYATKELLKTKEIKVADFGFGVRSSHPLVAGPLGKWFDHMKGNRKFQGESIERISVHGK
jgi:hypothetical protein